MTDWTKARFNNDLPDEKVGEIQAEYLKKVEIPASKPPQKYLLCPVGLVGAGKSTVTVPLAKRLGLVRISADEIRKILKENGYNYNRAREISLSIIREFLAKGYSVAIDANCGSSDSYPKIKELEKEFHLSLVWLRINPPEEFIINKLQNMKHAWLFENGDEAVQSFYEYKKKYGDFGDLDVAYTYVFDTSRPNLQNQVAEASDIVRKAMMRE